MPKRISLKDKSTFYYAYKIGKVNGEARYGEILSCKGQFTQFVGARTSEYAGTEFEYSATAILQYDENTKLIDEFTNFWCKFKPETSNSITDYSISRVSKAENGLITLYLTENKTTNNCLWVEKDGVIYEIDVKYDYDTDKAYISKNTYCPIETYTKIWYREPENSEDVFNMLTLISKDETDNCIVYQFEKVELPPIENGIIEPI